MDDKIGLSMKINVNGEVREIENTSTITQLLAQLALTGKRLAVEVNLMIVPRSQFDTHTLQEGDKVEIIHAIGGG